MAGNLCLITVVYNNNHHHHHHNKCFTFFFLLCCKEDENVCCKYSLHDNTRKGSNYGVWLPLVQPVTADSLHCWLVLDSRERDGKSGSRECVKCRNKRHPAPPRDTLALHNMLPPMVYVNCEWRIPRVLFHSSHRRKVLAREHLQ